MKVKAFMLSAGVLIGLILSGTLIVSAQDMGNGQENTFSAGTEAADSAGETAAVPAPGAVYEENGRGIAVAIPDDAGETEGFSSEAYIPDERRPDKTVIGYDDRMRIYDTWLYPYSAIAFICADCPYGDGLTGTGFMISKNAMLTAAHCIYCREHNCFYNLRFYFGYQPDGRYGYAYTRRYTYWYPNGYPFGRDYSWEHQKWDHAYIRFDDENVGDITGWLGFASLPDAHYEQITSLEMTGYRDGVMKTGSGNLLGYDTYNFTYDLDTEPGNSGSPVFYNGSLSAIGINVSYNDTWNTANRISDDMLRDMEANGLAQINWYRTAPEAELTETLRSYEIVLSECSWEEADASARKMGGKLACPDSEEKQKELADFLAAYPGADSVWVSGAEGETDLAWTRETGETMPGSGEQMAYVVEYD